MTRTAVVPPLPVAASLGRRLFAEFLGTGLLVAVVVGSGIAAQQLSPNDIGIELLQNSTATVFGLAVLILMLGPVSGAHFNPVVSLADWFLGRRAGTGLPLRDVGFYSIVQCLGSIGGALLGNAMFGVGQHISTRHRATGPHFLAEVVATGGLLALIFALARTQRGAVAAPAVGAYIGAAYWFTSSTSFANPAVTAGRIFSNTFAGIGPASALVFITAQLVGLVVGVVVIRVLYPDIAQSVAEVVLKGHWRMPDNKPTVLVSCIHNSGRSVAAAGFLRHLAGDRVNVISRGSDPGTGLNPQIVAAMAEVGIDVTDQTPTRLEDSDVEVSDVVITMACGESCTWFPGKRYEDWEVEDPKGKDLQTVRGIRDDIKARVETLLGELLRTGVIS